MPVRDGTRLGCDLSLPGRTARDPAPGKYPAILANYTPYYKLRNSVTMSDGALFSTRGYAMLTCSVRGTGDSQGTYSGCCARDHELLDGYDLIEWMARQPWSNGRVGMEGDSYGGLTSLGVAALHPPHLQAVAPQQPPSDLYKDYVYPGGMKTTPGKYDIWPTAVSDMSDRPELGAAVEAEWLAHPNYDNYWRSIAYSSKLYPKVVVPTLLIQAGRPDNYFRGSLNANYKSLIKGRRNAWMIVGPWAHGGWSGATPPRLPPTILIAWFDRFLAGRPGAPTPGSHVVSYQEPQGAGAGWQSLNTWPTAKRPQESGRTRLYLAAGRALQERPGGAASTRFSGQMPTGSSGFSGQPPTTTAGTSVLYISDPKPAPMTIRGEIGVHLRASSSGKDANLYAEVWDVASDGTAIFLSDGSLKASHRETLAASRKISPGHFYDFNFSIWPVDWTLAAGHRLELRLSGGAIDFFLTPTTPPPAVTVAMGGSDPSYLSLP
ncbi:CocE/NonD family hydrolase [Actinomadura nitritigenes]|uniref:CocE/NonD family hydrolase n=1 Tax=Actinomadura nitritigenes TaxID=134602 RepID=UPI003D9006C9